MFVFWRFEVVLWLVGWIIFYVCFDRICIFLFEVSVIVLFLFSDYFIFWFVFGFFKRFFVYIGKFFICMRVVVIG